MASRHPPRFDFGPGRWFDLAHGRASYRLRGGLAAFVASRYQGSRPFNLRNAFFADALSEWDAGVSCEHDRWRVSFTGRNLGDDRHVVTESEIGDAQFYVAPPRRFVAQLSYEL